MGFARHARSSEFSPDVPVPHRCQSDRAVGKRRAGCPQPTHRDTGFNSLASLHGRGAVIGIPTRRGRALEGGAAWPPTASRGIGLALSLMCGLRLEGVERAERVAELNAWESREREGGGSNTSPRVQPNTASMQNYKLRGGGRGPRRRRSTGAASPVAAVAAALAAAIA